MEPHPYLAKTPSVCVAHAYGFIHVAQGKFDLNIVFIAAQQQANGGLVPFTRQSPIDYLQGQ